MKILAGLFLLFAVRLTAAYAADAEVRTFPAAELTGLSFAAGPGDIAVEGSTGDVRVEITGHDPEKCFLTIKTEAGQLVLRAEDSASVIAAFKQRAAKPAVAVSSGAYDVSGCRAGFRASAPPELPLKTQTTSGGIKISTRAGEVGADSESGEIMVDGISGAFNARTGSGGIFGSVCAPGVYVRTMSGEVALAGLCGSADAKAGSGGITLRWADVPVPGEARVQSVSGDIVLVFPPSAKIAARLDSGSGEIINEFDDTGEFQVAAGAGSGDISVLKAGN